MLLSSLRLAIKIPNCRSEVYLRVLNNSICNAFSQSKSASEFLATAYTFNGRSRRYARRKFVTDGFESNIREFIFWLKHRDRKFIVPTYFSFFGAVNIMPLGEAIEDGPVLMCLWRRLTQETCEGDDHHFANNRNFVVFRGRLCSCDYGGLVTQGIIERHLDALDALPLFTTVKEFADLDV